MPADIDPFNLHPATPLKKKKSNDIVTLEQVRDIIEKASKTLELSDEPRWGYSRWDVIKCFRGIQKTLEEKCQDN